MPIKMTEEQKRRLEEKADALGFTNKSDYVRFVLFMEPTIVEKIDQIHKKVCGENE